MTTEDRTDLRKLERRVATLENKLRNWGTRLKRDAIWRKYMEDWVMTTFNFDLRLQVELKILESEEQECEDKSYNHTVKEYVLPHSSCQQTNSNQDDDIRFRIVSSQSLNSSRVLNDNSSVASTSVLSPALKKVNTGQVVKNIYKKRKITNQGQVEVGAIPDVTTSSKSRCLRSNSTYFPPVSEQTSTPSGTQNQISVVTEANNELLEQVDENIVVIKDENNFGFKEEIKFNPAKGGKVYEVTETGCVELSSSDDDDSNYFEVESVHTNLEDSESNSAVTTAVCCVPSSISAENTSNLHPAHPTNNHGSSFSFPSGSGDTLVQELENRLVIMQERNKALEYLKRSTVKNSTFEPMEDLGDGVVVPTSFIQALKRDYTDQPKKFIRRLIFHSGVFTLEEIANSSLKGRPSHKHQGNPRESLNQNKLRVLKDFTLACCGVQKNSVEMLQLESSLSYICGDARKRLKRLQSQKDSNEGVNYEIATNSNNNHDLSDPLIV